MRRRLLRLATTSDDEGEDDCAGDAPQAPQNLVPPPPLLPQEYVANSGSNPNPPLEISDDDEAFVDVPDDLSPTRPSLPSSAPQPGDTPPSNSFPLVGDPAGPGVVGGSGGSTVALVGEFLQGFGLRLRPEWLESCVAGMMAPESRFGALDVAGKARLCFEHFLLADMNSCGAGVVPQNVHSMHAIELQGPFVLQVDEITNISAPLRERYQDTPAGPKRCLKLSMTDGVQRIFGMEYRPIKELEVLAPAGLKVLIRNVHIRRGLLMLVPECFEVLGGLVDDLDAARKRLVDEVNKPARSKRKQGPVPLAQRASLAAWSTSVVNQDLQANIHMLQNENSNTEVGQVVNSHIGRIMEELGPQENLNEGAGVLVVEESSMEQHDNSNVVADVEPNTEMTASDMEVAYGSVAEGAADELDHPLILSGDREIPFTYLACLFAKWATREDNKQLVQGKIKCFLTGVKGFHFKNRSTYELCVYIDDGSLISEVLVDHNVVERGIGHSPKEVTTSLSSSDKKILSEMREKMKRFQLFLAKFEGIMIVELNEKSSLPLILDMSQGCLACDSQLLLRRLKSFTSIKSSRQNHLNPIVLSP